MEDLNFKSNEEGSKLNVIRAIELIKKTQEQPEPNFIWKGIPEGSKGLITGAPKTGKTTFAENLAISLAIGRKSFFGCEMNEKAKKVLFVNLEESVQLRSRRNGKQIKGFSLEELKLFSENYFSTPEGFPSFFNTDEDWELLRDFINECDAEVIFIDSLSHLFVGEIEKSKSAQNFFQLFNKYIGNLGKTIIIVHHTTKGNKEPITQDNVAGSRFVLQEFEFAYGMAKVPTKRGGSYLAMLYNKHIEQDDTAELYNFSKEGWVEKIGTENKYSLYEVSKSRDGRVDDTNKKLVYDYILSQTSQTSQTISSAELNNYFTGDENRIMSKDTLFVKLNQLVEENLIIKPNRGEYILNQ